MFCQFEQYAEHDMILAAIENLLNHLNPMSIDPDRVERKSRIFF